MRKSKRTSADEELDITPMIDVTFLLLIFFMVSSNMQKPSSLDVPATVNGTGIDKKDATVLTIFKTDKEPEIYLSDGEKSNGPVSLADVTNHVQRGIPENKLTVIIKADRGIPSGFVEDVAKAAAEVEADLKYYIGVLDKPKQ